MRHIKSFIASLIFVSSTVAAEPILPSCRGNGISALGMVMPLWSEDGMVQIMIQCDRNGKQLIGPILVKYPSRKTSPGEQISLSGEQSTAIEELLLREPSISSEISLNSPDTYTYKLKTKKEEVPVSRNSLILLNTWTQERQIREVSFDQLKSFTELELKLELRRMIESQLNQISETEPQAN